MVYRTEIKVKPTDLTDLAVTTDLSTWNLENFTLEDGALTSSISAVDNTYNVSITSTGYVSQSIPFNELPPTIYLLPVNEVEVLSDGVNNYPIADKMSRMMIEDKADKDDIPTVNNATLTIQKNGTNVQTFTANASSNATANITVPTDTGDLTNGAGFLTSSDISNMVTTDTAQTITELKTIDSSQITDGYALVVKMSGDGTQTTAGNTFNSYFAFNDTNNVKLGEMNLHNDSAKNNLGFAINNPSTGNWGGTLAVAWNKAQAKAYAYCPTPFEDTNNSTQIDTVGARNTKLAGYVDTSTNQNIGGTKRFTDSVQSQNAWNISRNDFTKGDIPTSTKYFGIMGLDALPQDSSSTAWQDKRLGVVESCVTTSGETQVYLRAYKNATQANGGGGNFGINLHYPQAGSGYADLSASPSLTDCSKKIPTTEFVRNQPGIFWYGTSSSAADATEKVVTISGYNSALSPSAGQCLIVKPSTTSTVADSTIKIVDSNNNVLLAAKAMRYNNTAITTSTDSVVWNANYPTIFMYDGTYWVFLAHGVDSNTTYSAMSVAEGTTGTATSSRTMRADYLKDIITARMTTQISGYDATKTQTLKNVNGTLRWVTD